MSRTTDDLVQRLLRDLRPVRLVPPLHRAAAAVALAAAVSLGLGLAVLPVIADPLATAGRFPAYGAMLAGLALTAAGGVLAALAAAVPGRESAARAGGLLAAAGALLAGGLGGVLAFGGAQAALPPAPLARTVGCLALATLFAVPPGAAALAFAVRAAPLRPLPIAVAAVAGGVAVGALVAHLTCGHLDALHLLLAHALAPTLVAGAAALPLVAVLHLARRAPA